MPHSSSSHPPHLLILAGPTGVGKTRTAAWLMRTLHVPNPVRVLVDDLVQADDEYVAKMRQLLRKGRESEVWQREIDTLYFRIRDEDGCVRDKKGLAPLFRSLPRDMREVLQAGGGCSAVANAAVAKALLHEEDLLFETTGHTYPGWIVSLARRRGYRVVLCYTLASFETLLRRNRARMAQSMAAFDKKQSSSIAPRMPDLTPHTFHTRLTRVHDELLRIVREDVVGCARAECVDDLLVVSNERRLRVRLRLTGAERTLEDRRAAARTVLRLMATYE